jgi:hypothetical protein
MTSTKECAVSATMESDASPIPPQYITTHSLPANTIVPPAIDAQIARFELLRLSNASDFCISCSCFRRYLQRLHAHAYGHAGSRQSSAGELSSSLGVAAGAVSSLVLPLRGCFLALHTDTAAQQRQSGAKRSAWGGRVAQGGEGSGSPLMPSAASHRRHWLWAASLPSSSSSSASSAVFAAATTPIDGVADHCHQLSSSPSAARRVAPPPPPSSGLRGRPALGNGTNTWAPQANVRSSQRTAPAAAGVVATRPQRPASEVQCVSSW